VIDVMDDHLRLTTLSIVRASTKLIRDDFSLPFDHHPPKNTEAPISYPSGEPIWTFPRESDGLILRYS